MPYQDRATPLPPYSGPLHTPHPIAAQHAPSMLEAGCLGTQGPLGPLGLLDLPPRGFTCALPR